MNIPLAFAVGARIRDPFDNPHVHRNAEVEPSNRDWGEAFADWRPPCFGRLALEYVARFGLYVLPLLVEGREHADCAVPRGAADASCDPATIHAWWTRAPRTNVGIACEPSGLLVLEINPHGGGRETLAMHVQRLGALPSTWTARTPAGWTQYFFSHADPDVSALLHLRPLGPGVQVTHRGYVLAPPSLVGGVHSAWHFDARPGRVPLAAMPAPWLDRLTGRVLPPNGLSGLDARHSILGRVFESLGWLGRMLDDGRRIARCPWMHKHAWPGATGGDTATVVYSPESEPCFGGFACRHPECVNRRNWELEELLPKDALAAAHTALPREVRPSFADDELEIALERGTTKRSALEAAHELMCESRRPAANDTGVRPDAHAPVCH